MSASKPRRLRPRRTLAALVVAGALAAGWLLRDNIGMGWDGQWTPGAGTPGPANPEALTVDAQPVARAPCELVLNSNGLTLDGKTVSVARAVQVCSRAGKARLRATGGARAGTYDDLLRALDQAKVPVEAY